MLPRATFLLAVALLLAVPSGSARPGCAATVPDDSTAVYPLNDKLYLVIDKDHTENTGFWQENNTWLEGSQEGSPVQGLQIHACTDALGVVWYEHDVYLGTSVAPGQLIPALSML